MSSNNFDRKELSRDPFQETFYAVADYVYRRGRMFILAGAGLLVALAAVSGYYAYTRYTERADAAALLQADGVLHDASLADDVRVRTGAEAYRKFVYTRPGSALAPVAWMALARLAWDQRQWEAAGQAFQQVLDHRKTPAVLRTEALLGLGQLKEQEGKPAEAKALYEQIGDSFQDARQLELGRAALAAGNTQQAREYFLQASAGAANSSVTIQARQALDYLP
ncbi:MAG: tetratricopeptide repeat protein [SAR324 cluster bacterium]